MDAAVQSKFNKNLIKQVVLPKKYFDFSNIFDKAKADKLPEHSHHNLAIKLIDDRQQFFEPIYIFSELS